MPSTICVTIPAAATVMAILCTVAVSNPAGLSTGTGANTAREAVPAKIAVEATATHRRAGGVRPPVRPPAVLVVVVQLTEHDRGGEAAQREEAADLVVEKHR